MGAERRRRLLVLYASQTGNAQDAAERVGREAERRGCPSVAVLSVDEFDASWLPREDVVIFIVSTTGQGDMPDAMKDFWKFLRRKNISNQWLEGVHYAVFGLGDSAYQKYNFAAKKLDRRLSDIGGTPLIQRGLGDDQHPSGYEGAFDPWISSSWSALHQLDAIIMPRDTDDVDPSTRSLDTPKFKVIFHNANKMTETEISASSDFKYAQNLIWKARAMSLAQSRYIDLKPQYLLQMITNQRLTKFCLEKDVRHLEFESPLSALRYKVGDVLEVLPAQNPVAVDAFIQRCNLDPDCYITVQPNVSGKYHDSSINRTLDPVKLKTFVEFSMDVASASPRRYFFEVMSFFAKAEHEKERLQYFASPEGRDDLYQYNQKERRTVLEVLEDFPSVQMPFEWLVQLVPPLRTRAFSISSSHLAHPNQVHLTVNIVSWTTPFKRKRHGLCSTWFSGLDPQKGVPIPAWIHEGSLPPPEPTRPLILVGPGTGCAPFRGFVEERSVQSSSKATAPVLFFFGCRNEGNDFLYNEFWHSHAQNHGVLSAENDGGFFVAFSRDQSQKVYVQHKMKEERTRVWRLLSGGADVYVAGSSTKMPTDVTSMLEEIVSEETGVSRESAARWIGKKRDIGLERAGNREDKEGALFIEAWS
uniref:NADPH-dependent diflavin oxidoreductase 1 n=1 Tax=Anthurium amnicola TaxID=1678845 RepID=A0A1D1ZFR5_9ARAE